MDTHSHPYLIKYIQLIYREVIWTYYVLLSNMYWFILFKISRTFLLIERG